MTVIVRGRRVVYTEMDPAEYTLIERLDAWYDLVNDYLDVYLDRCRRGHVTTGDRDRFFAAAIPPRPASEPS